MIVKKNKKVKIKKEKTKKLMIKMNIKTDNTLREEKPSEEYEEVNILKNLFSKYTAKELLKIILEEKKESFTLKEYNIFLKLKEGYKKAKKEGFEIFTFKETFRFSTRNEISKVRIDTLKKNNCVFETILDSTAGIGLASIYFSKYFKKVYSVEIDILRYLFLKKNLELYNIKNVEAYNYDIKSREAKKLLEKAKIIFVDPERIEKNKERFLEENTPELKFFLNLKKPFFYELSPRIKIKEVYSKLKEEFETKQYFLELFSKNNRHSRTTLYCLKQKKDFNIQIKNEYLEEIKGNYNENFKINFKSTNKKNEYKNEYKYLLDIDTIILKSTLIEEYKKVLEEKLEEKILDENFYYDGKRLLYFTNKIKKSIDEDTKIEYYITKIPFTNIKKIVGITKEKNDLKKIVERIKDFNRLILKFSIKEEEYYSFVNSIRKSEKGNIKVYLYKIGEEYIITI